MTNPSKYEAYMPKPPVFLDSGIVVHVWCNRGAIVSQIIEGPRRALTDGEATEFIRKLHGEPWYWNRRCG